MCGGEAGDVPANVHAGNARDDTHTCPFLARRRRKVGKKEPVLRHQTSRLSGEFISRFFADKSWGFVARDAGGALRILKESKSGAKGLAHKTRIFISNKKALLSFQSHTFGRMKKCHGEGEKLSYLR